ncbi:related to long-chain-fatty-acid-CoA ligase [Phialocephala subalpina]|uniref:Related to long-chain-fatty-acid-CoA ligase n=1 Tax=Phialocephala subalpina TaxID=576137 RepID=A0A1L7WPW2_9HELO|nr:related to long-chain-fatty-acid-CoA ligase [Phialocephala subalpina]
MSGIPSKLSLIAGPTDEKLWNITLSQLLLQKAEDGPSRKCLVFAEDNYRITYMDFYRRTLKVAKGLMAAGIVRGDHIGVMAGNCLPYVELLFAASHVGAVLVVFNNTYTALELKSALKHSECKIIFTIPSIGKVSNAAILNSLNAELHSANLPRLKNVILLKPERLSRFVRYDSFVELGRDVSDCQLDARMRTVEASDVCNLQFTSGTTGSPKAAMLTHNNIVNNGRFIGDRMRLSHNEVICCPPPLFHCFGLVLGLLAVLTHGACIVFPSETFNPAAVLQAVSKERCTALHGVPAMFSAELMLANETMDFSDLRTGIVGGAPAPRKLMEDLRNTMNLTELTNTYGMTETSPATFMTFTDDPIEKRLSTVGKILPHTKAKIIDVDGNILPLGSRGELCVAGFSLQKGYWQNPAKTAEVMRTDENGILWMHTGDEAMFDKEGYCSITGRIKDVIIRGGENIYPLEIEERLVQHPSVVQSSVVGIPCPKYGETVAAFLQHRPQNEKPPLEVLRKFVHETLGWHKAPVHIWWLSEGEDFPKTGSGKIKKHVLRVRGERLQKSAALERARL